MRFAYCTLRALTITHPEKGWAGKKSTRVKLRGASKQRKAIKEALGAYRGRHAYMREHQAKTQGA